MVGSGHDFTTAASRLDRIASYEETCGGCHISSAPEAEKAPAEYEMYRSENAGMGAVPQPAAPSLVCLSCHDGTMGRGVEIHLRGNLGTDLSDDHPVSVVYDEAPNPSFRSTDHVRSEGLALYRFEGRLTVECTTCHDPHDTRREYFLRMSNDGSRLCTACHVR